MVGDSGSISGNYRSIEAQGGRPCRKSYRHANASQDKNLAASNLAAVATYGAEHAPIEPSQLGVGQLVASYKKLKALVPVCNDLMRFSDPSVDALVRDDLVKVLALRQDLGFLFGDGTQDSPRGLMSLANIFAATAGINGTGVGGVAGNWLTNANSTEAVGGNFITSNETYTLNTINNELFGLCAKLDTANVPANRRCWIFHPRTEAALKSAMSSLGTYVWRDQMEKGTLLGYPYVTSTQIPINIWDVTGTNQDCSYVLLVEMSEALLFESLSLELAISHEAVYFDSTGATQSAFTNDETVISAIMEHDFLLRYNAAVAVAQFVRWSPSFS
jgi:HK97 family phage major capsid protein